VDNVTKVWKTLLSERPKNALKKGGAIYEKRDWNWGREAIIVKPRSQTKVGSNIRHLRKSNNLKSSQSNQTHRLNGSRHSVRKTLTSTKASGSWRIGTNKTTRDGSRSRTDRKSLESHPAEGKFRGLNNEREKDAVKLRVGKAVNNRSLAYKHLTATTKFRTLNKKKEVFQVGICTDYGSGVFRRYDETGTIDLKTRTNKPLSRPPEKKKGWS